MGKGNKAARKGWKKKYGGVHKRDSGVTNCDECGLWPCMNSVCYPPHEDCDLCHCDKDGTCDRLGCRYFHEDNNCIKGDDCKFCHCPLEHSNC
jgi:hypothetical protein